MRYLAPFHYFQAVAKVGSVRKAAEDLAITSSALNRRIQDFEAEMGVPLFERHAGGLRLNAAGELALRFVQNQKFEVEKLRSQISDIQGLRRGHVALAATQALTARDLPLAIAEFTQRHAGVTFDVKTLRGHEEEGMLRDYEIEVAFSLGRPRGPEFEIFMSVPRRIAVALGQDHPLASQPELRLSDLIGVNLALPNQEFRLREILELAFRRQGVPMTPLLETDDFSLGQVLSATGGFASFRLVAEDAGPVAGQGMCLVPVALRDLPPVELQALKLRSARMSPLTSTFVQQVSQQLTGTY